MSSVKSEIYSKTILVDVDGVLLDWVNPFVKWMIRHGFKTEKLVTHPKSLDILKTFPKQMSFKESSTYIKMFNDSNRIRFQPPLRDAVKYVKKLHEEGYVFHAITSFSDDPVSIEMRRECLSDLFGPTVFESFMSGCHTKTKDEFFELYRDTKCIFVEDNLLNCRLAATYGLKPVLLAHDYNKTDEFKRFKDWKELYNFITTDYFTLYEYLEKSVFDKYN